MSLKKTKKIIKLYSMTLKTCGSNSRETKLESPYSFLLFEPTIFNLGLDNKEIIKRFIWFSITRGRLKIFYILDEAKVVHSSYIIPKNFRFPFMKPGEMQIGPCFTMPEYRGRGLYFMALRIIPILFYNLTDTLWIYTTESNKVSQHVIEKAGFTFCGLCYVSRILKVIRKVNSKRGD